MLKSDSHKVITTTERLFEIHPALLSIESTESWLRIAQHVAQTASDESASKTALNILRVTLMISELNLSDSTVINPLLDDCFSGRELDLSILQTEIRQSA